MIGLLAVAGLAGPRWTGRGRIVTSSAGSLLLVGGVLLATRAVRDLGRSLTPFPYPREDAALVTTGAFTLVRHPIYGGVVIASFGWALMTAAPRAVAVSALVAAFFDLKSRREEIWLARRYPSYEPYRQRTRRRLIPGLW